MFYEQLEHLCTVNSEKITPLVQKLGYSRGNVAKWKAGVTPNGDIIKTFAKYFGVSTDYLLEMNNLENTKKLNDDQNKVLNYYGQLNDEDQDYIKGKMVELIREQGKKMDVEFSKEWAT